MRFAKRINLKEKVNRKMVTCLVVEDQRGLISRMDPLYRKLGFNDAAKLGLFRKNVAENSRSEQFVMYRPRKDYKGLKKAIGDFSIGQEAFFGTVGKGSEALVPTLETL